MTVQFSVDMKRCESTYLIYVAEDDLLDSVMLEDLTHDTAITTTYN